jgi:hypothetical protein
MIRMYWEPLLPDHLPTDDDGSFARAKAMAVANLRNGKITQAVLCRHSRPFWALRLHPTGENVLEDDEIPEQCIREMGWRDRRYDVKPLTRKLQAAKSGEERLDWPTSIHWEDDRGAVIEYSDGREDPEVWRESLAAALAAIGAESNDLEPVPTAQEIAEVRR